MPDEVQADDHGQQANQHMGDAPSAASVVRRESVNQTEKARCYQRGSDENGGDDESSFWPREEQRAYDDGGEARSHECWPCVPGEIRLEPDLLGLRRRGVA